ATALRVKSQSGSSYQSFLRFDLSSLAGSVLSARLRLSCTDASTNGGTVHVAPMAWTETGLTWANKPALPAPLRSLGAVTPGWVEVDVPSAVTGPGQIAFALAGGNTNSAQYSSREGATPPQLVVTTGTPSPPTADFGAAPVSGPAPLSVVF